MGVDLDGDLVLGARSQHLLDVDLLTGPALESGHVADDVVCGLEMALTRRSVCAFRSSLRRPWMLATTKSKRSNTSPGQSSERSADVFEACQPARRGGGVLDKTTGSPPAS